MTLANDSSNTESLPKNQKMNANNKNNDNYEPWLKNNNNYKPNQQMETFDRMLGDHAIVGEIIENDILEEINENNDNQINIKNNNTHIFQTPA